MNARLKEVPVELRGIVWRRMMYLRESFNNAYARAKEYEIKKKKEMDEAKEYIINNLPSNINKIGLSKDKILQKFTEYYNSIPITYRSIYVKNTANDFIKKIKEEIEQKKLKAITEEKTTAAKNRLATVKKVNATNSSCYATLGLKKGATKDDIIKSYRSLPVGNCNEQEFNKISQAYTECLKDIGITKGGRRKTRSSSRSYKRKGTRKMRR